MKAPTLFYVFLFIALRALRFEARFVIFAGLSAAVGWITLILYALGGGARAYSIKGGLAFEGGPGIRDGMLAWARRHNMLPC